MLLKKGPAVRELAEELAQDLLVVQWNIGQDPALLE
jgi:hypothetical protein